MINFWARRLPQEASKNEFLLIKLVPVKDLITLLPIQTDPPPDRTVRFFIIIRRANMNIVRKEGIQPRGEMARVVYEVLGSKPPPVVPATRKRRGRGKARGKGPYGDSNASMREAERPAGPDPNPRVPVEGGTGLTIFEYGGVLMANHAADEQMARDAAAEAAEALAKEEPSDEALISLQQQATVEDYPESEAPSTATMELDHPILEQVAHIPSHEAHYGTLPDTQTEIPLSDFAARDSEEVISHLYYENQPFYDPYNIYTHHDLELHDPNQHLFAVVGGQTGPYATAGFFQTPQGPAAMQGPGWDWQNQYQ